MYKVLKDVLNEKGEGTRVETNARVGGRVRSKAAKEAVAKTLKKGVEMLDDSALLDLKTGEIKKKKKTSKKEKTPEELALKEAKAYSNRFPGFKTLWGLMLPLKLAGGYQGYPNYIIYNRSYLTMIEF